MIIWAFVITITIYFELLVKYLIAQKYWYLMKEKIV